MNLSSKIEFDCPFIVDESSFVHTNSRFLPDLANLHAPSVYGYEDTPDPEIDSDEWEFYSSGYTGQHMYNGPVMHNSEMLSGRLEADILANPGAYVVTSVYYPDDDTVEGWVVLRKKD